jgi:hypothetical protein
MFRAELLSSSTCKKPISRSSSVGWKQAIICKKPISRSSSAGWKQGTFRNLDPALEEEIPSLVSKKTAKEDENTKEEPKTPQQETNHPPHDNRPLKAKPVSMENSTTNWLELTFNASSRSDFSFHASNTNLQNEASAEQMEPVVEQLEPKKEAKRERSALQEQETPRFSGFVVSKKTAKEDENTKEEPKPPKQETNRTLHDNRPLKAEPVSMENSTTNWLELTFNDSSRADCSFHASNDNLQNEASAQLMEPVVEQLEPKKEARRERSPLQEEETPRFSEVVASKKLTFNASSRDDFSFHASNDNLQNEASAQLMEPVVEQPEPKKEAKRESSPLQEEETPKFSEVDVSKKLTFNASSRDDFSFHASNDNLQNEASAKQMEPVGEQPEPMKEARRERSPLQEEETPRFSEVVASKKLTFNASSRDDFSFHASNDNLQNEASAQQMEPVVEQPEPKKEARRERSPLQEEETPRFSEVDVSKKLTFNASSRDDFSFHASNDNLQNEASAQQMEPVVEQPEPKKEAKRERSGRPARRKSNGRLSSIKSSTPSTTSGGSNPRPSLSRLSRSRSPPTRRRRSVRSSLSSSLKTTEVDDDLCSRTPSKDAMAALEELVSGLVVAQKSKEVTEDVETIQISNTGTNEGTSPSNERSTSPQASSGTPSLPRRSFSQKNPKPRRRRRHELGGRSEKEEKDLRLGERGSDILSSIDNCLEIHRDDREIRPKQHFTAAETA